MAEALRAIIGSKSAILL